MTEKKQYLMLPVAAVAVSLLSGCASMGNLFGQSPPALSPAAKAAAEMPLEKDPVVNTQETYLALVKQMQVKSLWYASLAHLDAMDQQWGASSDSRLLRADALRQVGQLNAAVGIYQGLLGSAKEGAARYGLGRVAAEKGDFRNAAQQMEQARMSNPVDSRLLSDLGYAYLQARDLNAARIPLMQAAQLAPEDVQINVNLSLFMMVSGQSEQAEEFMRQRKLDGQTQQAIKEQAGAWKQGKKQAESLAAADPAMQATGKVVNLSRPEIKLSHEVGSKSPLPAEAAPAPAAVQEVPPAKKFMPESELVQAPVVVAQAVTEQVWPRTSVSSIPSSAASPVVASSAGRMPGAGPWMVSGAGFDSGRPRYPGQGMAPLETAAAQTYAYAPPLPMQSSPSAPSPVLIAAPSSSSENSGKKQPEVIERNEQIASVSVAHTEPKKRADPAVMRAADLPGAPKPAQARMTVAEPGPPASVPASPSAALRQPSGAARSLQEGVFIMAAARSDAVRQAVGSSRQQTVQAILPSVETSAGLFFETPDVDAQSKSVPSGKPAASEPVWP